MNGRAFPVQIVDLQLDIVHLGVLLQDLLQQLGAVVIGKAGLFHQPLLFQALNERKFVKLFCDGVVFGVEPVEQIAVEIVHAAALQLLLKIPPAVLLLFHLPRGQLGGDPEG